MRQRTSLLDRWRERSGSLRTQLIAWNVLVLMLLLVGLGAIVRYTVQSFMMASIDRELEQRVHRMISRPPPGAPFLPPLEERGPNPFDRFGPRPPGEFSPDGPQGRPGPNTPDDGRGPNLSHPRHDDNGVHPNRYDLNGKPLDPIGQHSLWDAAAFAEAKQGRTVRSRVVVDDTPYRVLSAPAPENGPVREVVQAPYPLTEVDRAMAGLNGALLLLLPLGLLSAGVGGAYLTDRVLRRVDRLAQAAEAIGAQEFARRLPVMGRDEFSKLALTFNGLLGRLESAFREQKRLLDQQRRFTADASHELKTPLTIIKGNTSMALSAAPLEPDVRLSMQEIDRAADTMSQLVQDLLLLARSDGGHLGKSPIDVLVREVLERASANVAHVGGAPIRLNVEDEMLTVRGNEAELTRLFANLLDNARRYTPPEGQIMVTAGRREGRVVVTVADTGLGIAPEHLPHLGERFYRVDTSRSRPTGGTGLGLSICQGIAAAHQATLQFQSVPGAGTTVAVRFPLP